MFSRILAFFSAPKNQFFEIPIRVGRGPNCSMPEHLVGAIVCCYAAAPDYETALTRCVLKLKEEGYVFEDVVGGRVCQLDPGKWREYVEEKWREFSDHFPGQKEVIAGIDAGRIFYGPFLSYES